MQYIIVGDTDNYKGCLIYVCGRDKQTAEDSLYKMLNNPNEQDSEVLKTHTNIRIKTIEEDNCWWNNCTD